MLSLSPLFPPPRWGPHISAHKPDSSRRFISLRRGRISKFRKSLIDRPEIVCMDIMRSQRHRSSRLKFIVKLRMLAVLAGERAEYLH